MSLELVEFVYFQDQDLRTAADYFGLSEQILERWHQKVLTTLRKEVLLKPREQPTAADAAEQGWPKFWNLLSFILPGDVKEQVYEPAMVHLLKDYNRRLEFSGEWARGWIHLCFVMRTLLLAVDCLRCLLAHRAFQFVKELFVGK